jgi:hypothetical protein
MINTRLDIIIPTHNRFAKLVRMLKSIPQYGYMELHIICDGDPETHRKLMKLKGYWKGGEAKVHLIQHRGSVYARNLVTRKAEDAILWATDDIIFEKGCIESAWDNLKKCYPDGDGVVGFNQHNAKPPGNFCWTGVAIMGQTFLRRYPDKLISWTEYFHFGTREIEYLARKVGRLYKDPLAKIYHFHPDFLAAELDETHYTARAKIDEDMQLKKYRRDEGLIWGYGEESSEKWKR